MRKMTDSALREAFSGESQAHMKYTIFASQAALEGLPPTRPPLYRHRLRRAGTRGEPLPGPGRPRHERAQHPDLHRGRDLRDRRDVSRLQRHRQAAGRGGSGKVHPLCPGGGEDPRGHVQEGQGSGESPGKTWISASSRSAVSADTPAKARLRRSAPSAGPAGKIRPILSRFVI